MCRLLSPLDSLLTRILTPCQPFDRQSRDDIYTFGDACSTTERERKTYKKKKEEEQIKNIKKNYQKISFMGKIELNEKTNI